MILAVTIRMSGLFWQVAIPELFERRVAIEQKVLLAEGVAGQSHFRGRAPRGGQDTCSGSAPLIESRSPHGEILTRHVRYPVRREGDS